jgi:hypothetical protein
MNVAVEIEILTFREQSLETFPAYVNITPRSRIIIAELPHTATEINMFH